MGRRKSVGRVAGKAENVAEAVAVAARKVVTARQLARAAGSTKQPHMLGLVVDRLKLRHPLTDALAL